MTNIVQAREAAITAETRVETLFNKVIDKLHELNEKLTEYHDAIKAAQPIASGSVCLELYPCGPGCTACPHPRWMKYKWTTPAMGKGVLMSINLDAQKKDPILALARKEAHYERTANLIRGAKAILRERSSLLAFIRQLSGHAANFK